MRKYVVWAIVLGALGMLGAAAAFVPALLDLTRPNTELAADGATYRVEDVPYDRALLWSADEDDPPQCRVTDAGTGDPLELTTPARHVQTDSPGQTVYGFARFDPNGPYDVRCGRKDSSPEPVWASEAFDDYWFLWSFAPPVAIGGTLVAAGCVVVLIGARRRRSAGTPSPGASPTSKLPSPPRSP